jgi:hypothetical protein
MVFCDCDEFECNLCSRVFLRIAKTSTMADAKAAAQQRKDSEKEGGKKAQDIAGERIAFRRFRSC